MSGALAATAPSLAEILRRYAPVALSAEAARVVRDLVACRTPLRRGRREVCDHCGDVREIYAVLLSAAAETLLDVTARRLNATPGVLGVLHTWNQVLGFHPHVHCLVTGGGVRHDLAAWVATRQNFLLPARILRRVFEAKLRLKLSQAAGKGQLAHSLATTRRLLWLSKKTKWRIYAKAPFAGPQQVLRYLGRYTHRSAISNASILAFENGRVTFAYRERRHGNRRAKLSLQAPEFVRRFLRHVVPKRFLRVRHYGILQPPQGLSRPALPPTASGRPAEREAPRVLAAADPPAHRRPPRALHTLQAGPLRDRAGAPAVAAVTAERREATTVTRHPRRPLHEPALVARRSLSRSARYAERTTPGSTRPSFATALSCCSRSALIRAAPPTPTPSDLRPHQST